MITRDATEVRLSDEATFRMRLEYAQRCFTNAQELTRFMDQKAASLLTSVGLLTSAFAILAGQALKPDMLQFGTHTPLKVALVVALVAYVVIAFSEVYDLTTVYTASPGKRGRDVRATGLLFPLATLTHFSTAAGEPDEKACFAQATTIQPMDVLWDYAEQILEVSRIYQRKQARVNQGIVLFRCLAVLWLALMALLLAVIVLA